MMQGRASPGPAGRALLLAVLAWALVGPLAEALLARDGPPSPGTPVTRDPRRAREIHERSLLRARATGDTAGIVRSLVELSGTHLELHDFPAASHLAGQACEAAEGSPDGSLRAIARLARGDTLFYQDDYPGALEDYRAALELSRVLRDRKGEADALKNVAITQKYLGEHEAAIDGLREVHELFAALGDLYGMASALENLGGAYEQLGDDRRALEAYKQAGILARRTGDGWQIQHTLLRTGALYLCAGLPELALGPLEEALAIIERLGLKLQEPWALQNLSRTFILLGRIDEAIELQRRAVGIGRSRSGLGAAMLYSNLGEALLARDPVEAFEHLEKAYAIMRAENHPFLWVIHARLAAAHRKLGRPDRALELYRMSIDEIESTRSLIASEHYRTTFFEKHRSVYEELVELLFELEERRPGQGSLEEAFRTLERSRARRLVEAVIESDLAGGQSTGSGSRRREVELTDLITTLQRELLREDLDSTDRARLLRRLDRAEEEIEGLVAQLRRNDQRYAALRYPEPVPAREAQALLDERTAMLAYFVTPRAVFAMLVTRDTVSGLRLAVKPEVLADRVMNYVDLIAADDSAAWQHVSSRLTEDLLADVMRLLPGGVNRLIVLPDGALNILPFETLIHTDTATHLSRGRFLIEDFGVSYAPSATALAQLRAAGLRGAALERTDLAMFAAPRPPEGLRQEGPERAGSRLRALYEDEGMTIPSIPFTTVEAETVRRLVEPASRCFIGDEASEERVKSLPIDRFRVIHFATHGLVSVRWPARSALVLSASAGGREDGLLQAREIYDLRLNADLVVLSGCQTARGRLVGGEGVQGLAQAFLHAGSQSLLASLWDVDDESTATLMRRFYEKLAQGLSRTEALREAKIAMLRTGARGSPRLWAPFVLIGEGGLPVMLRGGSGWRAAALWLLAAAVVLMAGVSFWYRRISLVRGLIQGFELHPKPAVDLESNEDGQ